MAHIFKHPNQSSKKGIVIFSHKEIQYFSKGVKKIRYDFVNAITEKLFPSNQFKSEYETELKKIANHYFIGVHYGWKHIGIEPYPMVDFYMAGEGTISFKEGTNPNYIPLCSRNFIPKEFKPSTKEKFWDIICVARAAHFKNLKLFLKSVKKIYQKGHKFRVLLIAPPIDSDNPKKVYLDLMKDYGELFSRDERQLFTIIKLSRDMSFLGMPQETLIHFYQSSKLFTLFSDKEGESRVISEALLCGLKVVAWKDLKGGGLDYLDSTNSYLFDSYENAHESLIEGVEKYDVNQHKQFAERVKELNEINSLGRFKEYMIKLYEESNLEFDNELINLDRLDLRLPGHYVDLAWGIGENKSADIKSKSQFDLFKQELKLQ